MEEIITVDGNQFKLSTDRPLTTIEKAQTIEQIRKQTGCGTCGQPRTMSAGFSDIYSMTPTCVSSTKSSGDFVTLAATPSGAIGPYHVRFWRKSAPGAYTEIWSVQTIAEFSSTSTSFQLTDADFTGAIGDSTAATPTTGATGAITDPETGSGFTAGKIRVATTTYDSCPTGAQSCVEYCDVNLACVAPICNFVGSYDQLSYINENRQKDRHTYKIGETG